MTAPTTPTTQQIADNVVSQISAQIAQQAPLMPKSFTRVLAKAIAGVYVVLYKYSGFIFKQLFVTSATDQTTTINGLQVIPLNEWGRLVGIPSRTAATQAQLTAEIAVTLQTGVVRSGTQLIGKTNGITYATQGDTALNGSTVQVVIRAVGDQQGADGSGTIGNLTNGAIVAFANPLPNVSREASIVGQVVTGADAETTESFRSRILDRFQKRPQGGAYADYEQWAEEAPGTLRAYPYTGANAGEVDIYIESSTEADGIPTGAQLTEALEYIEQDASGKASRRPIGALVNAIAITRTEFTVEISGLTATDLASVKTQIETAAAEYFASLEPFIIGLSIAPRRDRISQAELGGIINTIVLANGGQFTGIEIEESATPVVTYDLGTGEKAKAGAVTYI